MKAGILMDGPGAPPPDASEDFKAVVEQLYGLARFGMKLGLDRIQGILNDLDNPERAFRAVHVAGSNGKGSTCAFLATTLARHGLKVGLYSSPHLISLVERVQIYEGEQQRCVGQDTLVAAVRRVEAVRPGLKGLTFFEVMTAAGLLALEAEGVELAVIEAGLGAKLDATRVVPAELSVLTDLSLEHTAILGPTIEDIAADEGQVTRPGRPLVAADGPQAAMRVIDGIVAEAQAPLHRLGEQVALQAIGDGVFDFRLGQRVLAGAQLSLRGPHQGRNAALAAMAATLVAPDISDASLRRGLAEAIWPGRMEVRRTPEGARVLLDGAQNAQAARALATALSDSQEFEGPLHFVFGVLSDKDADLMLAALLPLAAGFCLTRPDSPRAKDPDALRVLARSIAALAPSRGAQPEISCHERAPEAFEAACARARLDGGWVVVCGSLYLVGQIRGLLERVCARTTNLRGFSAQ